jgi:type IV pilus assembly protein PilC
VEPAKKSLIPAFLDSSYASERVACFRELAALYRAGIHFGRAFEIIAEQATHPRIKEVFASCKVQLMSGKSIARSISAFPDVFPELYVSMVEVGEVAGCLDIMFDDIARHAEKERSMAMRMRSAMTYPAFVIVFCVGILIVGPAYMFRGLYDFLIELKVKLPLMTRILIMASALIRSPFFLIGLVMLLAVVYFALKALWKERIWRHRLQQLLISIPGVGRVVLASEIASLARALSVLYSAGVSVLKALELTRKSCRFVSLQDALEGVKKKVTAGSTLQEAFESEPVFPKTLRYLIVAGERSGEIPRMLSWASRICDLDVEQATDSAISIVQPFLLLFIGVIVGFMVLATIGPLLRVVETLM